MKRSQHKERDIFDDDEPEVPASVPERGEESEEESTDKALVPDTWTQVVEKIYEHFDVSQEFRRLIDCLEVGEQRGDYGTINRHLDRAETNARKAHVLYLKAVAEKVRFEHANETTLAALRSEAHRSLQSEKDHGMRAKAITDADVRAKMMELYPDEVASQELKKTQMHGMVEHCQHLVDCWKSRCRTLQAMLAQIRR